jgi:arylsulfatase A-like enzyme
MRVLYLDVDTLRADHLGCYGYPRPTSPNIDRLAAEGVRFAQCYASDVPCLPSRTALCTGMFGTRTGVVGHGGSAAELLHEGKARGFSSRLGRTSFAARLRRAGLRTVTLSSFAERHSAFHWLAGFQESATVGKRGLENADEVYALASDWLARNGQSDNWFAHVHFWDPHTPYRAPASFGEPFADAALPAWLTEEVRARHWQGGGPNGAQECVGFSPAYPWGDYPRQPKQIDSMAAVRSLIDGFDTGVLYADRYIGRLLEQLDALSVLHETAIIVSADHGETLGELNVYGDHHTADEHVARLPMIVRWPGVTTRPRVDEALCYQFDLAASFVELLGGEVPESWDGKSFARALREERSPTPDEAREHLVITQGAWTCQRGVRFEQYLALHTLHDGYHDYPEVLLFDLARDPHELTDLAAARPELVERSRLLLARFCEQALARGPAVRDPLTTVLAEGGPAHVRGELRGYLERLRTTGRAGLAARLSTAHSAEI